MLARFAAVRSTIRGIPRPRRKSPEAQVRLKTLAGDFQRRELELGKDTERLRADRDAAIRNAYNGGMAMADIATILGMSHQRISQIVRSYEQ